MIHSTPDDEALTAKGVPGVEIELCESHGCIHVKPADIDDMIRRGFMKPGNPIFIHSYTEQAPIGPVDIGGHFPYEVHFFPMFIKIVVKGIR